jgi:hypothetical protein
MIGYIKLHRKFIEWEWFNIPHMVQLFIYLLLSANHKDGDWRGIKIKRGQLLTGLNRMNTDTGISIQTLRTCLSRLEKTGEITSEVTNKYRVITICNYDTYQDKDADTNKPPNKQLTSNQQTTNKQLTTNKNDKNKKNEKNKKIYKAVKAKLNYDLPEGFEQIWLEWLEYKTESKFEYTEIGMKKAISQFVNKYSYSMNAFRDAVNNSIACGYQGIFPSKQPEQKTAFI